MPTYAYIHRYTCNCAYSRHIIQRQATIYRWLCTVLQSFVPEMDVISHRKHWKLLAILQIVSRCKIVTIIFGVFRHLSIPMPTSPLLGIISFVYAPPLWMWYILYCVACCMNCTNYELQSAPYMNTIVYSIQQGFVSIFT